MKNYSLGIDIGTNSVGWAVVDGNYQLMKRGNHHLWGSRLFDDAETAEARRLSRSSRRRYKRRSQRVALLQELVKDMVLSQDENFFTKLRKSVLVQEDKGYGYNLFADAQYTDKDFYQEFPTMYHVRKKLCDSKDKADPRLVYLALHHILKYRGNFLYQGQEFNINDSSNVTTSLNDLFSQVIENQQVDLEIADSLVKDILDILGAQIVNKEKLEGILNLLISAGFTKEVGSQIGKLLCGYETSLNKLFLELRESDEKYSLKLGTDKFDEKIDDYKELLQESFEIIEYANNVFGYFVLKDILNESKSISDAMVKKYDNHASDLALVKKFILDEFGRKEYNSFFKKDDLGSYSSYIDNPKKTSKEELYLKLQKIFKTKDEFKDMNTYNIIMNRIELNKLLDKQTTKSNGQIPYQLQLLELKKIIENQSVYYNELKENKDKLESILTFRIPYYVGPLNNKSSDKFHWIVRKEGKIYPWNFDEMVDKESSAEKFIRRMTNTCTYLLSEEVLPLNSILYSRYILLNELNKIRIDGVFLPVQTKEKIINELFMKKKKVKEKDLRHFLKINQLVTDPENCEILGYQKELEFSSTLTAEIDFKKIFGNQYDEKIKDIELMIEWITVYEEKEILKIRLRNEFAYLSEDQIKIIASKSYKGWGRLSRKLISGIKGVYKKTMMKQSIIEILLETNLNFMQIINSSDYNFEELINVENGFDELEGKITAEEIANLQGSPALKKSVNQTVLIIEELVKIMGNDPENIFIEFARDNSEKRRTSTRVDKLKKLYKEVKDNQFISADAISELAKMKNDEKLEDILYLYLIQGGKCMYSKKPLHIDRLTQECDVDHILPQSYIKDDSLENKALVMKNENQCKGDNLLMSESTVNANHARWKFLKDAGLIGDKKFRNLTKTTMTDREKIGFINRQLVETRQINKHVANLLEAHYKNTLIVSVKAGLTSEFRKKCKVYKVREINDFHHAHDAYLATMIGQFILKKYPTLKSQFTFNNYTNIAYLNKEFATLLKSKASNGFFISQMKNEHVEAETGELIWEGNKQIQYVKNILQYKDVYVTKKAEEKKGQLFDLTISKVADTPAILKNPYKVVSINKGRANIEKYGGYTGLKCAYMTLVSYRKSKKVVKKLISIPRLYANKDNEIAEYIVNELGTNDFKIIKKKILLNQLIEENGQRYYLSSASEAVNANQLILDKNTTAIMSKIIRNAKVSDDEILAVYTSFIAKFERYYSAYSSILKVILEHQTDFDQLLAKDKREVLKELLNLTSANPTNANLNFEGYKIGARLGRKSGYVLSDNVNFIYQSITGIYETKEKL